LITALTTFQQWLLFSGTTVVVGCVAWRVLVMPRALKVLAAENATTITHIEQRVASLGLISTGVLFVAWTLRLVVQVMGFRDPFVPLRDDVSFLLFEIFWGSVWIAQGVVLTLLAVALWLAGRKSRSTSEASQPEGPVVLSAGWAVAMPLVVTLATTLAMSGHAMGVDSARTLAVTVDATHTLAAGVWMGTLAVILTVGRVRGENSPAIFASQIRSFSPLALVSGITLVVMGAGLAWKHLHAVSDLWTMTYGRLLSAKVALALVIFGLGFLNWRRGLPVCDTEQGAEVVGRRGVWEVSLAAVVILVTAVLVHSAKP
jgi:putative copper export protein